MILMYHRLTYVLLCVFFPTGIADEVDRSRLKHQIVIKVIAGYIVCGFIACELAWFLSCRPFWGYWALPVPNGIIYCPPPPTLGL